jgi:hypothetical protein
MRYERGLRPGEMVIPMKLPPTFTCTLVEEYAGYVHDRAKLARRRQMVQRMLRTGRGARFVPARPREELTNRIRAYLENRGEHVIHTEIFPNNQGVASWSCGCRVSLSAGQDSYVMHACAKHTDAFTHTPAVEQIV